MAYKVVMTADEMVEKALHCCLDLNTFYRNVWPYNLGYHHADGRFSWDCWNFYPKTLVWGWDDSIPVGSYQPKNLSTGLGDWNGWTILQCCNQISTDFMNVIKAECMLTYAKDHMGGYVGERIVDGKTYNAVECTTSFEGGVVLSWVDPDGTRRSCKGGEAKGKWHWHGKLPWVDYGEYEDVLAVDGSWGMDTTRYTQKMLGTPIDGEIWGQPLNCKKYLPAAQTSSWKFVLFGKGSACIKALQTLIGAEVDGKFGKKSVIALQTFLAGEGYLINIDGIMGAATVKAWQKHINEYFRNEKENGR